MSNLKTLISRGNLTESYHEIKCYIGSTRNEKIFSTNNENDLIFPRSSIKIFQAIPFSESNAIKKFKLNKKQIALSCSSHCGERYHIKELEKWLKKTNLKPADLKCGVHSPLNKKSSEKLFLSGALPSQLHNNCAGKHLAMLSSCLNNNFPIKNYVDFNHPQQEKIRKIFSKFTESKIPKKNFAVDGCSAPQYAFKIKELGTAMCNLLNSYNGKFEYTVSIRNMVESILDYPFFIGGSNNLDSNLINISKKNIFCKGGAEGVFLFAHLKKGIFGILKVKDGNERVLPSAIYALCKKFEILDQKELKNFITWNNQNLYNHAKLKIGNIKTIIA